MTVPYIPRLGISIVVVYVINSESRLVARRLAPDPIHSADKPITSLVMIASVAAMNELPKEVPLAKFPCI